MKYKSQWVCAISLPIVVLSVLGVTIAVGQAQPNYPNGILGIIGQMQAASQRQAAIAAAQRAWGTVDPAMMQCLTQALSPPPQALANSGIPPGDPRLRPYFQRCINGLAQAQAAREAASRQAAEEEQRKQAAIEAQRVDQQRRLVEQQRQVAEQRRVRAAQEVAYADVQRMPELVSYVGHSQPDLVFLLVTASYRLVRGLDGNFKAVGAQPPEVCWALPTTGASSAGFFLYAMEKLERLTNVTRFALSPCGDHVAATTQADVILFVTSDLGPPSAEEFRALGEAIRGGRLTTLLVATQTDYDAKVAADRQRQAEEAARRRELAAKIESGIDDGTLVGVGLLQFGQDVPQNACAEASVDARVVAKAISTATDPKLVKLLAPLRMASPLSLDTAFVELKVDHCQLFAANAASLRAVRASLKRDGAYTGAALAWIERREFEQAQVALAAEQAAQSEAQARAAAEAAKRKAEEQARERAAADSAARLVDQP